MPSLTIDFFHDVVCCWCFNISSRLRDLAAEFEVSRPIVRSALARLREEGLVVSRRGSGSFVASSSETGTGGYMQLKSVEDIAAWYEFRRMIESETAARAETLSPRSSACAGK